MRNIGIFTSKKVRPDELIEFVHAYCNRLAHPCATSQDETIVGQPPDQLYVSHRTEPSAGYFSDEELRAIQLRLGVAPESYVDIHLTSTEGASSLAHAMAQEIKRRWKGIIDYSGVGGDLELPPPG